ncbi:MAG: hypothetical protein A3E01_00210 [Gammaproteobacteria bacterium RIFCSPHIGHO2_12_FULL_63_22]|nr:MAG: hypothetical protein A3E01_00210 [Gammaproteobacteria bacterium RIFCSPHIGHO2_12_FULL_63_22]
MSAAELASSREERPAHVFFERIAVEDKAASLREGRYVARDIDYVNVTPAYSKDCYRAKAESWFTQVESDVGAGRTPERWLEQWREAYRRWQNGQEMPLNGTPIKGWGVISPAQQEMLIRMNCLTVEDLAGTNDEGLRRIGMGGIDLRSKAQAWLQSVKDHGPLTLEVTELRKANVNLEMQVATLTDQVAKLGAQVGAQGPALALVEPDSLSAADILPDPEPAAGKRVRHRAADPE